ncbi:3-hydroxyacyl-CoA dehydrogenase [Pluralibacter gergoviae]|uniref:3-hydroxyacyl-CoA dehydrogenase n=1 Tax=Pluralibacter gergoviae TaxID=61647 RepID=UPI000A3B6BBA|nr:3-hydroxyacyl-CoA dehydrogenase [Pluralibacter gergoviae]EKV3543596.1 3-hydroxyacyl-CoA dehydrogenase [Pluralibacter gergoviae]EKV9897495.1 3-hydroxyacyl-CoA dehydrogenase [Pluralibacter gergoviae]EKV9929972.1 3-hydroxyacyl-CoA dehydrogenase [Pluralibacter gergoviae]EKW9975602.1 3-hydroxyacyl-CoA dehydrogenase [Pluralibacter gergoviae]OUF44055.1 hypothetical protein AZ034_004729 [Pluralibacter gergoviae]
MNNNRPVAIIGAGSIGIAFALVFARAGFTVHIYDPDEIMRNKALPSLLARLGDLETFSLLDEKVESVAARVAIFEDQSLAVASSQLVMECAPEKVEVKRHIFSQLDLQTPADCILASASSAIPASHFTASLPGRERCLIAHPGNPPYLIPVIEIVPAPWTSVQTIREAIARFKTALMHPVLVQKEVEGFIFNRLQGAVLREAYSLIRDGVASVEDIDTVMTNGLGLRWSVIGPFETADLNTRGGIVSHAEKMGPAYMRIGVERGDRSTWPPELVATVNSARRRVLPLENWESRVAWRDRQLMALLQFRKNNKTR